MKRGFGLLLVGCGVALIGLQQTLRVRAAVPLMMETTFPSATCPEGQRTNGAGDAGVCAVGDYLAGWGGGLPDEVTSSANHSGGGGGRGFRHWRGDGVNNNGGGLRIDFTLSPSMGVQKEFWVRWYMRYQSGFKFSGLNYTKEIYVNVTDPGWFTWGFHGSDSFGISKGNGAPPGWTSTMGGSTGDGLWHCYEGHAKMDTNGSNGVGQSWIDGTATDNSSTVNYDTATGWWGMIFGSNQATVDNGGVNMYTDYDDIAISAVGRIGCLSGGGAVPPSAPANLRIIK
jgi:hypothetical protein